MATSNIRVSQLPVQVANTSTSKVRASQLAVACANTGTSTLRLSQVAVQVVSAIVNIVPQHITGNLTLKGTRDRNITGNLRLVLPDLSTNTYPMRNVQKVRNSIGLRNRIIALGGLVGDTELRSEVNNEDSQSDIGVRPLTVVDRSITNQSVLDLFAQVTLDQHGVTENVSFVWDDEKYPINTLSVGDVVSVNCYNLDIHDNFIVQTISSKQLTPLVTEFTATVGDYVETQMERIRKLESAKNNPTVATTLSPSDSIGNDTIKNDANIDFAKIDQSTVVLTDAMAPENTFSWSKLKAATVSVPTSKLTGTLVDAQIDPAANIAFSKLDPTTISITPDMLEGAQQPDIGAPSFSSLADAEAFAALIRDVLRAVKLMS